MNIAPAQLILPCTIQFLINNKQLFYSALYKLHQTHLKKNPPPIPLFFSLHCRDVLSGKCVVNVGYHHTRLAHRPIAHSYAFDVLELRHHGGLAAAGLITETNQCLTENTLQKQLTNSLPPGQTTGANYFMESID